METMATETASPSDVPVTMQQPPTDQQKQETANQPSSEPHRVETSAGSTLDQKDVVANLENKGESSPAIPKQEGATEPSTDEAVEMKDDENPDDLTLEDLQAAVDDIDENLDEAFGQAADTIWSFAASVTGKVSSVVKDQPGLENLRKNVTSRFGNLDTISRDLQSQIGSLAPTQTSIANLTGSMKSVAETVQRNAVAMEKAILSKANDVGTTDGAADDNADITTELPIGDPSVGVFPTLSNKEGIDEIAKVGETMSNALGQTVGGLWTGLWGAGDDEENEEHNRFVKNAPKTRFEKRIYELQANPDTYCEPAKDLDAFAEWGEGFDLDNYEEACKEVLYTHESIAELYVEVVPDIVEEDTFWMRYFFAKHILEQEEERRKRLLERAQNAVEQNADEGDEWGDDDWADDTTPGKSEPADSSGEVRVHEGEEKEEKQVVEGKSTDPVPSSDKTTAEADNADKETEEEEEKEKEEAGKKPEKLEPAPAVKVKVQESGDDGWGDDDWE